MKIAVSSVQVRNESKWMVSYKPPGQSRIRRFFTLRADADAEAQAVRQQVKKTGLAVVPLKAAERTVAGTVMAEIKSSGLSLDDLLAYYKNNNANAGAISKTLGEAVKELLLEKEQNENRPGYITSLRQYLNQFARGREGVMVSSITTKDIEAWFASRKEAKTSRASNLGRLSALFEMCWRKHYIKENPCDRVPRAKLGESIVSILTPMKYARLLIGTAHNEPEMLAWVACGLIAGLRPEETTYKGSKNEKVAKKNRDAAVGWKDCDLGRGIIRVDGTATKTCRRRIVHLEPAAIAWLKFAKANGAELPVNLTTKKRAMVALRAIIAEDEWPQDILRHTAASMLLAKYQDAGRIADELGNSAKVLLKNYKALMYKETAAKLLAITPDRIRSLRDKAAPQAKKVVVESNLALAA